QSMAVLLESMKLTSAAPREKASSPSAPVPQKASSTTASTTADPPPARRWPCSKRSKSAWRMRSAVGRILRPFGTRSRRPLIRPATMRMVALLGTRGGKSELVAQHFRWDFLHRALVEMAELKWPIGDADEPVHGPSKMLADAPNFPVLAFGEAKGEPGVVADLTVK